MPKIIPDLRNKILVEAKRELFSGGYKSISIRGVAAETGIAIGTIYDYFPSKSDLVVSVVLVDWFKTMARMKESINRATSFNSGLKIVYNGLSSFWLYYGIVFKDVTIEPLTPEFDKRLQKLEGQIESIIEPLFKNFAPNVSPFELSFITKNLLLGVCKKWDYNDFNPIILKIAKGE